MYNKLLKINNYKKHLKLIYYIQLIDIKLYNIFKIYNKKYLLNNKLNIIYNNIKIYNKKFYKKYNKYILFYYKNKKNYIYKKKYKKKINKIIIKMKKKNKKKYLLIIKYFLKIKYINNYLKNNNYKKINFLLKIKKNIIKKINKYLLLYYLFLQKNKLKNQIIIVVYKELDTNTNILIAPQKYINLIKKKKIIINEINGTILIDYKYSKQIKKKFKKIIKHK
ncbi:MAG: hypothetical protein ABUS76_00400 [Candidatus Shikimatogenerans sp. Ttur]|uniref:Uncharacterized protein n=1 Tax=Candidatus Shikimatogenerans sp. Ttur TaxID=3158569 RepID=A0AAU7ZXJ3_9FLAO